MLPPPPPRLSPPVTRAYAPTLSDALFLAASVSAQAVRITFSTNSVVTSECANNTLLCTLKSGRRLRI
ncbi:unnamed protein product [Ectocarpus sp. CCAP 1310/34]|nr:unnamed protein product [Ectocarpus sp. CCAP 1310/34]